MPITLEEAKVGMADRVDQSVVDTFQRSSLLHDKLTFDNAISPGTGGSTLTYGYTQLKTPATAGVRAINAEYTANEAKREKKTAAAVIMGGSFQVDRVLQNTSGAVDELAFQLEQKIKAVANEFHYLVINGKRPAPAGCGQARRNVRRPRQDAHRHLQRDRLRGRRLHRRPHDQERPGVPR